MAMVALLDFVLLLSWVFVLQEEAFWAKALNHGFGVK